MDTLFHSLDVGFLLCLCVVSLTSSRNPGLAPLRHSSAVLPLAALAPTQTRWGENPPSQPHSTCPGAPEMLSCPEPGKDCHQPRCQLPCRLRRMQSHQWGFFAALQTETWGWCPRCAFFQLFDNCSDHLLCARCCFRCQEYSAELNRQNVCLGRAFFPVWGINKQNKVVS